MRTRSRARVALLCGTGGFVLLQLALVVLLAWLLPWLRDPQYGLKERGLEQCLAAAPPDATTIVMLGSSRTVFGLDAQAAAKMLARRQSGPAVVYNFGLLGAGPCTTLLSLRRLLADGFHPDLLLLEVVPFHLGEQGLPVDLDPRYLPTASLRREEMAFVQRLATRHRSLSRLDWWLSWCLPCYHHRFALVSHTMPTLLHQRDRSNSFQAIDRCGWLRLGGVPGELSAVHRGIEPHFIGFQANGTSAGALEESLRLCRTAGIRTALVLMPEGPAFRSWYPPLVLTKIEELLKRLSSRYNVPVIDARDWIAESGFRDSHHLLSKGATQFSERLARTLSAPIANRVRAAGRQVAGAGE